MESKGLCVSVDKTKMMVNDVRCDIVVTSGTWPCAVCRKSVGRT